MLWDIMAFILSSSLPTILDKSATASLSAGRALGIITPEAFGCEAKSHDFFWVWDTGILAIINDVFLGMRTLSSV